MRLSDLNFDSFHFRKLLQQVDSYRICGGFKQPETVLLQDLPNQVANLSVVHAPFYVVGFCHLTQIHLQSDVNLNGLRDRLLNGQATDFAQHG
jgi:hypothetical protein